MLAASRICALLCTSLRGHLGNGRRHQGASSPGAMGTGLITGPKAIGRKPRAASNLPPVCLKRARQERGTWNRRECGARQRLLHLQLAPATPLRRGPSRGGVCTARRRLAPAAESAIGPRTVLPDTTLGPSVPSQPPVAAKIHSLPKRDMAHTDASTTPAQGHSLRQSPSLPPSPPLFRLTSLPAPCDASDSEHPALLTRTPLFTRKGRPSPTNPPRLQFVHNCLLSCGLAFPRRFCHRRGRVGHPTSCLLAAVILIRGLQQPCGELHHDPHSMLPPFPDRESCLRSPARVRDRRTCIFLLIGNRCHCH